MNRILRNKDRAIKYAAKLNRQSIIDTGRIVAVDHTAMDIPRLIGIWKRFQKDLCRIAGIQRRSAARHAAVEIAILATFSDIRCKSVAKKIKRLQLIQYAAGTPIPLGLFGPP